jgi:hypothetical protein
MHAQAFWLIAYPAKAGIDVVFDFINKKKKRGGGEFCEYF